VPTWRSPKVRRTRDDAARFVDLLISEMGDVEYHVCGSWRRGAPTIGDLDVVIVTPDGTMGEGDLFNPGIELPRSFKPQRRGDRTAFGDLLIGDESFHLDCWSCASHQRGAMTMFATGPGPLNIQQRTHALSLGYHLSQTGLIRVSDGEQVDEGTEESIYQILDLPWLTPADRQRWSADR